MQPDFYIVIIFQNQINLLAKLSLPEPNLTSKVTNYLFIWSSYTTLCNEYKQITKLNKGYSDLFTIIDDNNDV